MTNFERFKNELMRSLYREAQDQLNYHDSFKNSDHHKVEWNYYDAETGIVTNGTLYTERQGDEVTFTYVPDECFLDDRNGGSLEDYDLGELSNDDMLFVPMSGRIW